MPKEIKEELSTLKEYIALKEKELVQLKVELEQAKEQQRSAERKLEETQIGHQELKERVRRDLQQIRIKEKEFEAKLEILKRDSETLLASKDKKMLEMKRKIDTLEYEMESLRQSGVDAQKKLQFWKERIDRVLRALKLSTTLLESEAEVEEPSLRKLDEEVTQEVPFPPKKSTKKVA